MSTTVLIFSRRCHHSEKFYKLLSEYPDLESKISKVELETVLDKVPPELTTVPCIVENDTNLIMGRDAFEWLKNKCDQGITAPPAFDHSFVNGASDGSIDGFAPVGSDIANAVPGQSQLPPQMQRVMENTAQVETTSDPSKLPLALRPQVIDKPDKGMDSLEAIMSRRSNEVPMPAKPV